MKISTRHFGEMEISEDIVIDFEEGIPGFPNSKKFVVIEEPDEKEGNNAGIFFWLQSIDEPEIAIILMDVSKVMPDYDPQVSAEQVDGLGDLQTDVYYFYNVVVIPEDIEKMSVNLKAPILINDELKKGKQVLSANENHPIRYQILDELKRKQ